VKKACYNCKFWTRDGSYGNCNGYTTGQEMVEIVVASGYSSPDEVRTRDIFYCACFKNKHKNCVED